MPPSGKPVPCALRKLSTAMHRLPSRYALLSLWCCSVCFAAVAAVQSSRITLSARQHAGCQRQVRCLAETDTEKAKESSKGDAARQLLGMKGASEETNIWKIRLQLTKPVTWVPLIWGKLSSNSSIAAKLRLSCTLSACHHHCSAEQPVLTHMQPILLLSPLSRCQ